MTVEQLTTKIAEAEAYQKQLFAKAQYELGAIEGQIALMKQMLSELQTPEKEATAFNTERGS